MSITGYRSLSSDDIVVINLIKDVGNEVGCLIKAAENDTTQDQRWVAIARTHLQQGFMALVRAYTCPEGF
jgi:hypothetical protein